LLVKRSKNLKFYPGLWNGISGFLDDRRSIEQKVKDELAEEVGIKEKDIISIKVGQVFDLDEPKYKKTWIVHPVLVRMRANKCLRANKIKLDWEAKEFKWIGPKEVEKFKLVPGFGRVIKGIL
jgi:isopentenyldiphosphate isomerase